MCFHLLRVPHSDKCFLWIISFNPNSTRKAGAGVLLQGQSVVSEVQKIKMT